MESITILAISTFLAPFLQKGGEKLVEKSVEAVFEKRSDLASRFRELFSEELIELNLGKLTSEGDLARQIQENSSTLAAIEQKIVSNRKLLAELVTATRKLPDFEHVTISADKIAQVNFGSRVVVQNIENF